MSTRDRVRDEAGANSIAFIIVMPVLMLALVAGVQYFIKVDAQRTAEAAAEEGAAAARRFDGSAEAGQARAYDFLNDVDNDSLGDVEVSATRDGVEASVTVTGTADIVDLLPFIDPDVSATSTGPVERYTE
jgi:Flp pilus assembly protein TadG